MAHDKALIILAPVIVILLILHLSQDVVYGNEPGNLANLIAAAITGVWLCTTLAFARRRIGYVLLLVAAFLAPVVSIAHMSGPGVGEEIRGTGDLLFAFTLFAIAVTAPVAFFVSLQGLWRLKQGVLSFLVWSAIPIAVGGSLLGYVVNCVAL